MGMLAAHSMCGRIDDFGIDTKFELFSHVTRFFGYKVGYFFHFAVHVHFYSILYTLLSSRTAFIFYFRYALRYHNVIAGDPSRSVQRPRVGGEG
jgi:hypothetical protein